MYIQVLYSVHYIHQYKQPSTYKTDYTDACKTHYTIPVRTVIYLKVNPRFLKV
jgi:hypothetical protein